MTIEHVLTITKSQKSHATAYSCGLPIVSRVYDPSYLIFTSANINIRYLPLLASLSFQLVVHHPFLLCLTNLLTPLPPLWPNIQALAGSVCTFGLKMFPSLHRYVGRTSLGPGHVPTYWRLLCPIIHSSILSIRVSMRDPGCPLSQQFPTTC